MGKSGAIMMKNLREKRKEKGLCTRCGGKIEDKSYLTCRDCRDYISYHKKNGEPPPEKDEKIFKRLSKWQIRDKGLYDALVDEQIRASELADDIGVSVRSVERWLYEGYEPRDKNKIAVNNYLNKDIYNIDTG